MVPPAAAHMGCKDSPIVGRNFFFILNKCSFNVAMPSGGGEPLQSGAVCGGAGGQLRLHGLSQCNIKSNVCCWTLRCSAHNLPARRPRTLPVTGLFPFPHQTRVCDLQGFDDWYDFNLESISPFFPPWNLSNIFSIQGIERGFAFIICFPVFSTAA